MAANENLDLILRRHQEIACPPRRRRRRDAYFALSRELSELEPVVAAIRAFQAKMKERADLTALLKEPDLDADMRAMAQAELAAAETEAEAMSKAIQIALLKDAADEGEVILQVRAGTGGDEAALFAGDLFRMYAKYASSSSVRAAAPEILQRRARQQPPDTRSGGRWCFSLDCLRWTSASAIASPVDDTNRNERREIDRCARFRSSIALGHSGRDHSAEGR